MEEGSKKFIWVLVLIAVLLAVGIYFYSSSSNEEPLFSPGDSITRSFSMNNPYVNEVVTVTLSVDVQGGLDEIGVTVEETVPSGVSISSVSDGGVYSSSDNKIRWAIEDDPFTSRELTYDIEFSSVGTYNEFEQGIYIFISEAGESGSERSIEGDNELTVTSCTSNTEVCDGLDNDCNRVVDDGGDDLCTGNTPVCSGTDGCVCNSDLVNDITGNCDGTCDPGESSLPLDQAGNCNGICEEATNILDDPETTVSGGGNCNGCVDIGEIGTYKVSYLNGDGISAADYTIQRRNWLEGTTACA